ncbi:MAG: hypothetical protein V1726_08855 [Methanobacteriota archaeon]
MKEKNLFFRKAGNNKLRALAIVPIAFAIVFMLVVGSTIGQQQSADINKKITGADVANVHDECPCKEVSKKIVDALKMSGIGDINFNEMGEIDPGTMCSYYSDPDAYQYIVNNAALLGCGNSFNYVFVPGASQQSTEVGGIAQQQGKILFSVPAIPTQKQQSGHWEWQVGTEQRTAEQVVAEVNAIRAYWCQGTEIPPGTLDPGDWSFGQAMAFCVGFTGAVLQIPARIVNALAASVGMRFCLDLMVYSWIDHQLQEAGFTDVTALTIYQACFDYLTGGG